MGAPPGGPPDQAPPLILAIRPDSGAIVPGLEDDLVIQFDEVIEEMAGAGGGVGGRSAGGLSGLVLLSPVAGRVNVSWHRSSIHVKPREGWRPDRVYRLELLPGISDLRQNRTEEGVTLIFSTGPPLPAASLAGTALAWTEQRALVDGLILAAPVPDSIGYLAQVDSAGGFRLDGIPPGTYVVYAIQDANRNRRRDRREAYDSAVVTVAPAATVTLWTFVHDTVGPRLRQAEAADSLSVRLTFTQALDVTRPLAAAQIEVLALPDSTPQAVRAVLSVAAFDSLAAAAREAADSARQAAADSVRRAAGDTTPRAAAAPTPAAKPPATPAPPGERAAAPDSTLLRLLATRPAPSDRRVVLLARPLAPGARYLVRVRGAVNLSGAAADGQAVFETPKPAAAADSAARRDSGPAAPRPAQRP
jgi:hypothetical protein